MPDNNIYNEQSMKTPLEDKHSDEEVSDDKNNILLLQKLQQDLENKTKEFEELRAAMPATSDITHTRMDMIQQTMEKDVQKWKQVEKDLYSLNQEKLTLIEENKQLKYDLYNIVKAFTKRSFIIRRESFMDIILNLSFK